MTSGKEAPEKPPQNPAEIWPDLVAHAEKKLQAEPALSQVLKNRVLQRANICDSLASFLPPMIADADMDSLAMQKVFQDVYERNPMLEDTACRDLLSTLKYDPAARDTITPFLYFKGFHALQCARIALTLWQEGRHDLAYFLHHRNSLVFGVDIHPAAKMGHGITLDHATSIVIGETAIVGNDILMLHEVTLGTRGFIAGDRHPIIEDSVIIGVGAKILGRITVGKGARVAAGSIVLEDVVAGTTVAGVPAHLVKIT